MILLVEDNPGDVRLTREALRDADLSVELVDVPDGEQAMAYLRGGAERPDLVLLDLNLPKMNGLEVLDEIRADPELRDMTVIVLTTSSSARDIEACRARGVSSYVVKPLDLDEFTALIEAVVAALPRG